MGKKKYLNNLH